MGMPDPNGEYLPNVEQFQIPNVQQVPEYIEQSHEAVQEYRHATVQERKQYTFDQKSKDTMIAIGEIWGWGFVMKCFIVGFVVIILFRKKIVEIIGASTLKKVV